jgi:hypothetical protein
MEGFDQTILDKPLDFVANEAREQILDALMCAFHNTAGELEGNRPENDAEWFARNLWGELHPEALSGDWYKLPDEERAQMRQTASAAVAALPGLMRRVGRRCRTYAQAVNTVLKAERLATGKAGRRGR